MLSRTSIIGLLLAASAFAQMSSFPKPSYFREVFRQNSTTVQLRDPVRLKDFVVNGKLTLSLKDYLELVMANNTSIQVSFLSLEIPKNNITSVFGKWDPSANASFSSSRSTSVPTSVANSANVGLGAVSKSLNQPLSLSYTQAMDTGTSYTVSFSEQKQSFSNSRSSYNPSYSAGLTFSATQNLIRDRGRYVNRIPVMQAESSYKQSQYGLRTSLLSSVSNAESAYWKVINNRETLRVQIGARDAAKSNFDFVQQQLSLGAIADLDIYNPQGQLAAAEVAVSVAQFNLASAEDALRLQIGADLDPDIRKLPLELTEPVDIATDNLPLDPEVEVTKALKINPAMLTAQERLSSDELGIQSARNGLLPQLSFLARYSSNGLGGLFLPSQTTLSGGIVAEPIPGGVTDALSQMFGFGYPTYFGQLSLTLPLRSRTASMTYANSLITKKTDALNLRNQAENIRLSILNAVTNLKGSIEQLKLSKTQQDIQQKNLEAQQKKYELGTNTNQDVVLALQSKAAADAQYVQSQVGVRTSILTLLTQTGELLDERGIIVK
jgi:outer membrane protein